MNLINYIITNLSIVVVYCLIISLIVLALNYTFEYFKAVILRK